MKIHYTGKLDKLDSISQKKLDARLARLSKLLDKGADKELHIILKSERHLQRAELTMNVAGQPQAGIHAATDQLTALTGACDKLEKQLLKHRDKRLAGKRRAGKPDSGEQEAAPAAEPSNVQPAGRIYRVMAQRKPMTVDEALLEMDSKRDYVAYREAGTNRLSVLIRRKDGNLDLIES